MSRRESLSRDANESMISSSQVNYPTTRAIKCVAATPHFPYIYIRTFHWGTKIEFHTTQYFNVVVFIVSRVLPSYCIFDKN